MNVARDHAREGFPPAKRFKVEMDSSDSEIDTENESSESDSEIENESSESESDDEVEVQGPQVDMDEDGEIFLEENYELLPRRIRK